MKRRRTGKETEEEEGSNNFNLTGGKNARLPKTTNNVSYEDNRQRQPRKPPGGYDSPVGQ